MKRVVLITGTSTGLGLETALLFAEQGFIVYATMRDLSKKEALLGAAEQRNVTLQLVPLDVCDVASIEAAVGEVIKKEGRIDILVNNAGAGFAKSTEQASDREIQWVMETNYLSVVRCTKAVLPHMREQKSGHIINITSVGGLVGQPFNELYCAAKFAVEGYTEAMATYVTEPFGIHFTAVEPGGIATEFIKSATQKSMDAGGFTEDAYLPIMQKYMSGMQKRAASGDTRSYQQAAEVAQVVLNVVLSENPPLRTRTSEWSEELCAFKTQADPDGTLQNRKVINQFLGA